MTLARTATAAAVAGLVAVAALCAAAAWFATPGSGSLRHAVAGATAPTAGVEAWQYDAIGLSRVPSSVLERASAITVAVVDTGADLTAPDLAGRRVSVIGRAGDANGHGTFVTSILARSSGDAKILVVKAVNGNGTVSDAAEAAGIRAAVDRGARVLNLSIAGATTSAAERGAVAYAVKHGVLVVAAAGNSFEEGNDVEYPAALLQPVGSNGRGGAGLVVAASTQAGTRAPFSNTGSWLSLAAPGVGIFGSISVLSSPAEWPRTTAGFGYASGTSYSAPQVAGAAALVWAADPSLTARQVAAILKETASGHGTWTPDLGYGVLDVGAAVQAAAALQS
jgi:subtilisin family serine protease